MAAYLTCEAGGNRRLDSRRSRQPAAGEHGNDRYNDEGETHSAPNRERMQSRETLTKTRGSTHEVFAVQERQPRRICPGLLRKKGADDAKVRAFDAAHKAVGLPRQ